MTGDTLFTLMGVVNVTPDSFSDGGRYLDRGAAIDHGLQLEAEGAAILDIGGESTRPGAESVGEAVELERVIPVIEALAGRSGGARVSIDTSKAAVAIAAIAAGATMVNDVTALQGDPDMAAAVAQHDVDCCLMHMQGTPRTMQVDPHYDDVVDDVKAFLHVRMEHAVSAGIAEARIVLDPGIGFGKTTAHNLELLARLDELLTLGRPLLVGTSRKSFLGAVTGRSVEGRLAATIASNVLAYTRGARLFRVHDVAPVRDALAIAAATVTAPWTTTHTTSSTT